MTLVLEQALELEEIFVPGYEKVIKVTHKEAGLNAIICIHSTAMGPTLGGIRIYPYATFDEALNDVMRLSKGMTYKSAASECGWGGGKSVIIADPKKNKTKEMLLAFGQAVDRLQGEYICAEDVGCTPQDVSIISQATPYVVGLLIKKAAATPLPSLHGGPTAASSLSSRKYTIPTPSRTARSPSRDSAASAANSPRCSSGQEPA